MPTGTCDGGYYCTGFSFEAAPIALYGGFCDSGYYCPVGSTGMTPCTAGMYCATGGLSEPSGNCTAGYYCSGLATSPNPSDSTGELKCLQEFSFLKAHKEQRKLSLFCSQLFSTFKWAAPSEFGTYRLCEQRRFRRACASAQSRQNLRCSLIQAMSQEEPSDRKPDP